MTPYDSTIKNTRPTAQTPTAQTANIDKVSSTTGRSQPVPGYRASLYQPAPRRSTLPFRRVDHSQPPVENPNNTPERNAQLWKEYEQVQQLNQMVETVIEDFETVAQNLKNFNNVVDEADQLLDLWTQILSYSQQTEQLLDHASIDKVKPNEKVEPTASSTPAITTTSTPTFRKPKPVGAHLLKKRRI
ncbi:hypothetical protein BC941DRAFT_517427 [Chlamydoabsidia padenii]|nr:hypothetical protein BC941DRAFT_517427 [Chlamydoabsidia padenii]